MRYLSTLCFIVVNSISYDVSATDMSQTNQQITNGISNTVISCPWNGQGYIKLPGFDTCLKLGGELKTDIVSSNLIADDAIQFTDTAAYIESRLSFDTKTHIDVLKLSTYSTLKFIWDQETSSAQIEAHRAALEVSNAHFSLSGGIQDSLYTGFTGYSGLNLAGQPWSDNQTLQATLKIPIGLMTMSFSMEDVVYNDEIPPLAYYNYEPHVKTSTDYAFVGAIEYASQLLDIKLSGAFVNVSETQINEPDLNAYPAEFHDVFAGNGSDYNYAFNLNTEIRPSPDFKFSLGAQMGIGAMGYTGLDIVNYQMPLIDFLGTNPLLESASPARLFLEDPTGAFRTAILNQASAVSYTLTGGFNWHLIDNVFLTFDTAYQHFDIDKAEIDLTGNGLMAASAIIWKPTTALDISFGAGFNSYSLDGSLDQLTVSNETTNLKIGTRVQYVFDPAS